MKPRSSLVDLINVACKPEEICNKGDCYVNQKLWVLHLLFPDIKCSGFLYGTTNPSFWLNVSSEGHEAVMVK